MVRLAGLEPATHGLGNRCSIHLSYRRTGLKIPDLAANSNPQKIADAVFTESRHFGKITLLSNNLNAFKRLRL
jgi:hypothetical protein